MLGAIDLRRAQRSRPTRWRHGSVSSSPQLEAATCTGARELRAIDPVGFYALNVRILALAERAGLPLMTICNTCTLNLLDAHAAFVDDPELAAHDQLAARRGGPALQRTHPHQPLPLGALRRYRHRAAAAAGGESAHRPHRGGLLRLPHHASARALRLRRFAQQCRAGTACPRFSAAGRSTTADAPNAAASTPQPTTRGSRSS